MLLLSHIGGLHQPIMWLTYLSVTTQLTDTDRKSRVIMSTLHSQNMAEQTLIRIRNRNRNLFINVILSRSVTH